MYNVKGKGLVWDAEKDAPLARFVDGVFSTTDKAVADKLAKLGYEVEEEKAPRSKKAV